MAKKSVEPAWKFQKQKLFLVSIIENVEAAINIT